MAEYRDIPGFPDYQASTCGRIWTRRESGHNGAASWSPWRPMSPCRYHATKGRNPYLGVNLWRDGKVYPRKVHRLILETFVGPCPPGMQCRHLNGNASDNRLENLRWGTPKENTEDTDRLGMRRPAVGARIASAKLTAGDVAAIRLAWIAGESPTRLGRQYGLSRASVIAAATGVTWAHVPMPKGERKRINRRPLSEAEREQACAWKREGLSQREIARRLNIDPSAVSRLIVGRPRNRAGR